MPDAASASLSLSIESAGSATVVRPASAPNGAAIAAGVAAAAASAAAAAVLDISCAMKVVVLEASFVRSDQKRSASEGARQQQGSVSPSAATFAAATDVSSLVLRPADPVSVQDLRGRGRRIRRKRKRILQLAIGIYLAAVLGRLWAAHCLRMWTARVDERSDSGDSDSSDSDDSSCSDGSESDEDDASESNDKHQAGHSATGLPCIIVRDYSNGSPVDQEFESFMVAVRAFQSLKLKCRRAELVMNGVVKESFG